MGDLLIDFSPPHQANDNLYRMALACFEAVSENPEDLDSVLRYFEVWLLKLEGFMPDLRTCANCHEVSVVMRLFTWDGFVASMHAVQ